MLRHEELTAAQTDQRGRAAPALRVGRPRSSDALAHQLIAVGQGGADRVEVGRALHQAHRLLGLEQRDDAGQVGDVARVQEQGAPLPPEHEDADERQAGQGVPKLAQLQVAVALTNHRESSCRWCVLRFRPCGFG